MMRIFNEKITIGLVHVFIFFLLIVTINSCKKNEELIVCNFDKEIDLGEFSLLPVSRQSIPYAANQRVYFRDDLQNEVYFDFSEENTGYVSTVHYGRTFEYVCNDSAIMQQLAAKGDAYYYDLSEPQHVLNMSLHLQLQSVVLTDDYLEGADMLSLYSGNEDSNERFTLMEILVERRELSDEVVSTFPATVDNLNLGGKKYNHVYTNNTNSAYYNFEYGIIAFTDNEGKFWMLDRIENRE